MEPRSDKSRQDTEQDDIKDKGEENLSAKGADILLQKTSKNNSIHTPVQRKSRRQLGIYLPPHARSPASNEVATSKQPQSPLENAHPKKTFVRSSSLQAAPIQPDPLASPADVKYIVTVQIPLWLISRFIGQGCSIKSLKQVSGAEIWVLRHPSECSHAMCNITGSTEQIEAALKLIGQRFPEMTLPNHTNMKLFHALRHKPIAKEPVSSGIAPAVIPSKQFRMSILFIQVGGKGEDDCLSCLYFIYLFLSNKTPTKNEKTRMKHV